mgnify:CR=1 FL=1
MFETLKAKMSNSAVRATILLTTAIAMVGGASAAVNMTLAFQPIIDMITVLTSNTDAWIGLVVLGVLITIAIAIGHFVRGIMQKATGGTK